MATCLQVYHTDLCFNAYDHTLAVTCPDTHPALWVYDVDFCPKPPPQVHVVHVGTLKD